jgi:uncharacterized protein
MAKIWLPDVNFWLALTFQRHEHHASAKDWMTIAPPPMVAFCRMTQQGFLRLSSNAKVFGDEALKMLDAWQNFGKLFDDPRVAYAEEPEGLETLWRRYTQRRTFSPKVWNDAYLAAFAKSADFGIVTFDQGFAMYKDIDIQLIV